MSDNNLALLSLLLINLRSYSVPYVKLHITPPPPIYIFTFPVSLTIYTKGKRQ